MRGPTVILSAALLCCVSCVSRVGSEQPDCLKSAAEAMEGGPVEQAVRALETGAGLGDERCKFILGMWSLSGFGVERDEEAAGRWLGEAAEEGLPVAQAVFGLLLAAGMGVEQDEEQAARWFREAAVRGDPLGQAALGAASFAGTGVPKDVAAAYTWTSLAATQGNEKARTNLITIEAAMTKTELDRGRVKVAAFRPKETTSRHSLSRRQVLHVLGLSRALTERDRVWGPGW